MRDLTVSQAKPNPAGKDHYSVDIPNYQLAGEWVDYKNSGITDLSLDNIELYHIAYTREKPDGEWEKVMGFQGILKVGEVVRVHSGGKTPLANIRPIDIAGADYHLFTGKNYVWNNSKSDTAGLWDTTKEVWVDKARYYANPPEGKILKRYGDILV